MTFLDSQWFRLLSPILLGALAGLVSALIQDRLRRRNRLRAIAGALRVDLTRIRAHLGDPSKTYTDYNFYGVTRAFPAIHPWTERLVVDAGEISPRVVAAFMELERQLNNYAISVQKLREASSEVAYPQGGANETREREGDDSAATAPVFKNLEEAKQQAALFHDSIIDARKDAWASMDKLESLLASFSKGT